MEALADTNLKVNLVPRVLILARSEKVAWKSALKFKMADTSVYSI